MDTHAIRDDRIILRALRRAAVHLSPDSPGGAHTEVFKFEPERLARELRGLAEAWGVSTEGKDEAIEGFATMFSRRFILKAGHIESFLMKLAGGRINDLPRKYISEIFGPIGYNILPTLDKAMTDVSDAVRLIPYFAAGDKPAQLAPVVTDMISELVRSGFEGWSAHSDEGVFMVTMAPERDRRTVYRILNEDPYKAPRLEDFEAMSGFQSLLRREPIDSKVEERLAEFFDAPITVGVRDTVRWLMGSRHPEVSWEEAKELIAVCFERQGDACFIPPEVNFYDYDVRVDIDSLDETLARNERVAKAFAEDLAESLPATWADVWSRDELDVVANLLLHYHHDYPRYEIEPYSSMLSWTTLRWVTRFVQHFFLVASDTNLPVRRSVDTARLLADNPDLAARLEGLDESERQLLVDTLLSRLLDYMVHGGMPLEGGEVVSYEHVPTTFYSFQEHAAWRGQGKGGRVEATYTLEDLKQPEVRRILSEIPEIAEKLVVFFVLLYRYYLDTGFVPDLRPHDAGTDLFLLGKWGYVTENLLILVLRNEDGTRWADIQFIDNKDQFKQYKRSEDRRRPMGAAKHALRLIHPIVEPSMQRAIGMFVDVVRSNGSEPAPSSSMELSDAAERGVRVTGEVARKVVREAAVYTQAVAEDFIDDLTDSARRTVRWLMGKSVEPSRTS